MLRTLALFQSLAEEDYQYLAERVTEAWHEPGTVIFREGDPSQCLSIVLEGVVEIVKALGSADERIIKLVPAGEVIGEMSVLHQERSRTAGARAQTAVHMLEIPLGDFEKLLRKNAGLAYNLMRVMSRRLLDTENETIHELQEKNRQLTRSLQELKEAQAQIIEAEKVEVELSTARRIQQSMLPESVPQLPGWEIQAYWQPARAVSGDFYDFISLPDGRLAIVVGDVTDKGVPAALIMTVTRSMLRSSAVLAANPEELLARVNVLLCPDMPESMFTTCFVGFLDPSCGSFQFANAGHCLPMHIHSGQISELKAAGLPLGLLPDSDYRGGQVEIAPGDRLLFYSDGLIEAHNKTGKMYGREAVKPFIAGFTSGSDLIRDLLASLDTFRGDEEQEDDITLVCLARSAAETAARQAADL